MDRGVGVRETERRGVKECHRLSMANTMSSWGGSLTPGPGPSTVLAAEAVKANLKALASGSLKAGGLVQEFGQSGS